MTDDDQGPDLTAGIDASRVIEGTPLEGHVGEHALVLVRRGETIHALGAHCPHRGAAMASGLVVGDTIRCPWHHASFDLADGAARAPSLEPLPCWRVERDGETLRVRERATFAAPPVTGADATEADAGAPASVVVVGAGAAGDSVAATLRAHGYRGAVTLLSADDRAPIDRTNLSKGYLAGDIEDETALALRDEGFHRENDIELRLGARVESIDRDAHEVRLVGGERVPYAKLVLATGADAVALPVPGAEGDERLHVLRTLEDARGIVGAAKEARRAVVVGASFIGLEAASALRARGVETTVVAPDDVPLATVMGETLGTFVRELHEENGVSFRLGGKVEAVVPEGVRLEDGDVLAADLVVVGIGVKPAVALAEEAGLDVDDGVLVDASLVTSDPDILAVGDIARWPDGRSGGRVRVEHWQVAQRQGECAARNLLGAGEAFTDVPFFWSKHYGTQIRYSGHAGPDARVETDGTPADGDFAAVLVEGEDGAGEPRAMASVGRDRANLAFAARLAGERVAGDGADGSISGAAPTR